MVAKRFYFHVKQGYEEQFLDSLKTTPTDLHIASQIEVSTNILKGLFPNPSDDSKFNYGEASIKKALKQKKFTEQMLKSFLWHLLCDENSYQINSFAHIGQLLSCIEPESVGPDFLMRVINRCNRFIKEVQPFTQHLTPKRNRQNEIIVEGYDIVIQYNLTLKINGSKIVSFEDDIKIEDDKLVIDYTTPTISKTLNSYLNGVINTYAWIRLKIANVNIPIENIIQFYLKPINPALENQKKKLEEKLQAIQTEILDEPDQRIDLIQKQLFEINSKLNEEHQIFELIKKSEIVFLESPAGTGKTTMLKWVTYYLASSFLAVNEGIIPVFIELKFLGKEASLIDKIEIYSNHLLHSTEFKKGNLRLVVLLDGFDEYKGITSNLLTNIKELKVLYGANIQFVLSGREVPVTSWAEIEFSVYKLTTPNSNQIKMLFGTVDKENGAKYFKLVSENGFLTYFQSTLFWVLLASYLRDQRLMLTIDEVKRLIVNKGLLLKTVIVDQFISRFEKEKQNPDTNIDNWLNNKRLQIDLIAYLAFHMTVNENDVETIKKTDVKLVLTKYKKTDGYFGRTVPVISV